LPGNVKEGSRGREVTVEEAGELTLVKLGFIRWVAGAMGVKFLALENNTTTTTSVLSLLCISVK